MGKVQRNQSLSKKAFRSTSRKGFHLTFKNGWTVSVQFGAANYCENYDAEFDFAREFDWESDDAEVWSWNGNKYYPEEPLGYQNVDQVMKFISKTKRKR